MPYKNKLSNNKCEACNNLITKQAKRFCSIACFNFITKTKDITGYKKCELCDEDFPYRDTLKVRSCYSKKYKCMIGSINQRFCSQICSLIYRNKFENPAQTESGRKKISDFAKKRGTEFLHTEESHKKQGESISGSNHWNWQGGKTTENRLMRNVKEYRDWRKSVFERDDYTCVWCGIRNKKGLGKTVKLNADHIKPWSLFKNLRYEIDNGRTLCEPCHRKTDTYMGRIKNYKKP